MRAVPNLVNVLAPAHEHEFEAARGLPEALPEGEVQLWQGSPDARLLARQALHLDVVAGYFALLLAWRGYTSWAEGATLGQTLMQLAEAIWAKGRLKVMLSTMPTRITMRRLVRV